MVSTLDWLWRSVLIISIKEHKWYFYCTCADVGSCRVPIPVADLEM